jgi:hypothetical protein
MRTGLVGSEMCIRDRYIYIYKTIIILPLSDLGMVKILSQSVVGLFTYSSKGAP